MPGFYRISIQALKYNGMVEEWNIGIQIPSFHHSIIPSFLDFITPSSRLRRQDAPVSKKIKPIQGNSE